MPDPEDEKDLQTHIRIWDERQDKTLDDCVEGCQTSEDIVDRLIFALSEAQCEQQYDKVEKITNFIWWMRSLAWKKIDEISHYMLEHIDLYMPLE